jgi:hypothetical protein
MENHVWHVPLEKKLTMNAGCATRVRLASTQLMEPDALSVTQESSRTH